MYKCNLENFCLWQAMMWYSKMADNVCHAYCKRSTVCVCVVETHIVHT